MPVFKTFLKIVWKNKGTIVLYLSIFLGISISITKFTPKTTEVFYSDAAEPIAVIDNDNSSTSRGLIDFLGSTQQIKNINTDIDSIQDALYFRDITYLLTIPENFEQTLLSGTIPELQTTSVPNSYSGIYISMEIEQYVSYLRIYLSSGIEPEEALSKVKEIMNTKAKVALVNNGKALSGAWKFMYFYQYVPYMLLGILVQLIGVIFLSFNKEEIRKRTLCSSTTLRSRNFQLFLGCIVLGLGILVIVVSISLGLYKHELPQSGVFPWLLLNSLAFLVVSISLGFLVGSIVKNDNQLAALATSIAMIFSFLGGIFIPQELMSGSIKEISRFFPTYWYITINKVLGFAQHEAVLDTHTLIRDMGIQLAFAFAFFSLALAVTKKRSGKV